MPRQPRLGQRRALLGTQQVVLVPIHRRFVLDDCQRPASGTAQLLRRQTSRLIHQRLLDLLDGCRRQMIRQLLGGLDDHPRMVGRQITSRERLRTRPGFLQRGRQPHVCRSLRRPGMSAPRGPRRRVRQSRAIGDPGRIRRCDHPQLHRLQPSDRPIQVNLSRRLPAQERVTHRVPGLQEATICAGQRAARSQLRHLSRTSHDGPSIQKGRRPVAVGLGTTSERVAAFTDGLDLDPRLCRGRRFSSAGRPTVTPPASGAKETP